MRAELMPVARLLAAQLSMMVLILHIVVAVYNLQTRRDPLGRILGALFSFASYMCMEIAIIQNQQAIGWPRSNHWMDWAFEIPFRVQFAAIGLLGVAALVMYILVWRWDRSHISLLSIKQGVDQLDAGICYYWPGGQVKLRNFKMEQLCRELTGRPLRDGEALWKQMKDRPIRRFPDGRIYSFTRMEVPFEKEFLYEMVAYDVTEEYELTQELSRRERELTQYNKRLLRYSEEVSETAAQEEMLELKIRVHDELGRTLLRTRHHLEKTSEVGDASDAELRGLAQEWRIALSMGFKAGERMRADETLRDIRDAADVIGIKLQIEGEMPEDVTALRILAEGARTCLTNAYRHARASSLTLRIRPMPDRPVVILQFTSDGEGPVRPIKLGGGLSSLRESAERVGGGMRLEYEPQFSVLLYVPIAEAQPPRQTERTAGTRAETDPAPSA